MLGTRWRVIRGTTRGDWQSKLILIAQVAVGLGALVGVLALMTRNPLLLLSFLSVQVLFVIGVILFVIVALFAQRTMILERYGPGDVIVREGDRCEHIYVIKSGNAEMITRLADGTDDAKRLSPGDHVGEAALIGGVGHPATVRAITAVEVLKMAPSDFVALYMSLPELQSQRDLMQARVREIDTSK